MPWCERERATRACPHSRSAPSSCRRGKGSTEDASGATKWIFQCDLDDRCTEWCKPRHCTRGSKEEMAVFPVCKNTSVFRALRRGVAAACGRVFLRNFFFFFLSNLCRSSPPPRYDPGLCDQITLFYSVHGSYVRQSCGRVGRLIFLSGGQEAGRLALIPYFVRMKY